jgi:hypothetical protein
MFATFNGVWDWTAIGTLALAGTTLALAAATFWTVRLTRLALKQGRDEIVLSRREVEEAHRPVLVPLADSRFMDITGTRGSGRPSARPAIYAEGLLTVPIENIGTGPALRIEATVELMKDGDIDIVKTAVIAGLRAAGSVAPTVYGHGLAEVASFSLTLTYEDVAGRRWATTARYIETRDLYEDLTVDPLPRAVATLPPPHYVV